MKNVLVLVLGAGLEPARLSHTPLKRTRLPIPPPQRRTGLCVFSPVVRLHKNIKPRPTCQAFAYHED